MASFEEKKVTLEDYRIARHNWLLVKAGVEELKKNPEELLKDKPYQKAKKTFEETEAAFLKLVIALNFWDIKLNVKERLWVLDERGVEIFSIDGPMRVSAAPFEGQTIRVHRANMKHDGFERFIYDGKQVVSKGISFGNRVGQ